MQTVVKILFIVLLAMSAEGCRKDKSFTITEYGPDYMTYNKQGTSFDDACRTVLHELSDEEKTDEGRTRYPYYGEGGSSNKDQNKVVSYKRYLMTKDEQGFEYIITTIGLGKNDPVVILETTNPDKYKLVNALNQEFRKRGFDVRQY